MQHEDAVAIRSYRRITHMEHKLYRGFKVPMTDFELRWPGGLPWRGFLYAVSCAAVVLLVERVFIVGEPLRHTPAPLKYLILPAAVAVMAMKYADRTDGLPPHVWVLLWARDRLRRPAGTMLKWDRKLPVRWDAAAPDLHRLRVTGRNGAGVWFRVPVKFGSRGGRLIARPDQDGVKGPVVLTPGAVLEVKP